MSGNKGNRGGRRRPKAPNSGTAKWSNGVNDYKIPNTAAEALGAQGTPKSMADAFFDTNPYYSDDYNEFSANCQRCVMAYEMRRRGYDVTALPTYKGDEMPLNGNWQRALSGMEHADVGKTTERATINAIENQMKNWGEGARAICRVKWAGGNSGHVFNLEYTNGKLQVYDAQSNQRTTGINYLKEHMPYTTLSRTALYRTDNASVTEDMRFMVRPSKK